MNTALLIIDVQNDYLPNGRFELVGSIKATENIVKLIEKFRTENNEIIYIQHLNVRPGAFFFIPETDGVKIAEQIKPNPEDKVIQKNFPNSFRNTELLEYLRAKQIEKLVICGMMTHMCVDATTRAAKDLDYTITLIHDACATRDLVFNNETISAEHVHNSFIASLNGFYTEVLSTQEFLS